MNANVARAALAANARETDTHRRNYATVNLRRALADFFLRPEDSSADENDQVPTADEAHEG